MSAPLPTIHRRSNAFLLIYALANAGGVIGYLPLLTLLLPLKIERIAGNARLDLLAVTAVGGALVASAANIGFGWLSDRSVLRGYGRRRWMAGGLVAIAASYLLLIGASSWLALVVAVLLFQVAINALLAPMAALMADEVPDIQKGVAGGLTALAGPVASGMGAVLVGLAMSGEGARMAIIPTVTAMLVIPLLMTRARLVEDPATPLPPRRSRHDIIVAWAARLLVQTAGIALSLYFFYYVESLVPEMPRAMLSRSVSRVIALAAVAALPVAVLLGRLSDRVGRRKPFLLGAAALSATGLTDMALVHAWQPAAVGFVLYTIGAAVFLALHAGFTMQLLPDPRHRGRDLGLVNLTNTLPSVLGPLLAWLLATPHDFSALLLALSALTIAGGATMLGVRGRR
jgi:MFS family permease